MITVFALTLVFADGYLGGSTHARDFKDAAACNKFGAQMASQYTSRGHPASFVCAKTTRTLQKREAPEIITPHFTQPTLVHP